MLIFLNNEKTHITQDWILTILFSLIPNFFFIFDIAINVFTAYYEKGILIKQKIMVIEHFLKNDFPFDFFSLIIPSALEEFVNNDFGNIAFLLRIIKLIMLFNKMEDYLHLSDKINGIYEVLKLFFSIIFVDHLLACSWVYLAQIELYYGHNDTWFNEKGLVHSDWKLKYLYSLYFSTTTMITVGYGDIVPSSHFELGYCLLMMIISSGMFAYSLNKLGNILQEMYKKDDEFKFIFTCFFWNKNYV